MLGSIASAEVPPVSAMAKRHTGDQFKWVGDPGFSGTGEAVDQVGLSSAPLAQSANVRTTSRGDGPYHRPSRSPVQNLLTTAGSRQVIDGTPSS